MTEDDLRQWGTRGKREQVLAAVVGVIGVTVSQPCPLCAPDVAATEELVVVHDNGAPTYVEIVTTCCDDRRGRLPVIAAMFRRMMQHEELYSDVRPGIEERVATVHAQGGTLRALRFIAWADPQEGWPAELTCSGHALVVTIAPKVVEQIADLGTTVTDEQKGQLEANSGEYTTLLVTLVDGEASVHDVVFNFAAGGSA